MLWAVKPGRDLTKRQRTRNRRFGKVRAKVEHVFRVLKCQFGSPRPLSRHRQEWRAGVRAARTRQSVSRSRETCVQLKGNAGRVAP